MATVQTVRHDFTLSLVWLLDAMPPAAAPIALRRVREGLQALTAQYEILLVTREGATLAQRITGADPSMRVIVPERNGDAAALTAGCAAATGEYIIVRFGNEDPQWDALPALLPYLRQSDITLAFSPAPEPEADDARTAAALGFLYGAMPRDSFGAAQLYRAELLRGLTFAAHGPLLRIEMLAKTRAMGATFTEVAVGGRQSAVGREMQSPDGQGGVAFSADRRPPTADYIQAARLWLHLRTYRPPWIVRETPTALHPPSEYLAGGIALAAGVWAMRKQLARLRRG